MPSVYVGTSLRNSDRAKEIMSKFIDLGINISYDWTIRGQVFSDADLTEIAAAEINGVRECDLFFMIQPGRSGTHCELGIAIALHKPIIILQEIDVLENKSFYYADGISRCTDEQDAMCLAIDLLKMVK